ncbi:hypothetical protein AVEN_249118-1 [Araneus ventricosus]|uniref:Uncharacterized protein n=1 Tax=Araneus ventricosus TaxID=182803 RepID=A0A4Y2JCT5_ARAVE|nr:hypothetical protein AVEN_249118-1 [Araneus ventricosus]
MHKISLKSRVPSSNKHPINENVTEKSVKKQKTSCEDATEHTVTEGLTCDTEANQLYADEEIISLVQNKPQDDSDLEETDEPGSPFPILKLQTHFKYSRYWGKLMKM